MTPAARVSAAIEVLDSYFAGTPLEKVLTVWPRRHRFAGAKDRAAIRDHVFDAVRRLQSSQALGGGSDGRATMLGCLIGQGIDPETVFTAEGYAPTKLRPEEKPKPRALTRAEALDCPEWMLPHFDRSLGDRADQFLEALRHRAPVYLRINLARGTRADAAKSLANEGILARPHPLAGTALEVVENSRKIKGSRAFLDGYVEFQDVASQAVVDVLGIKPGMRVLDYCAGGGGKSLAMAALGADIVAHDIAPERMKDIPARANRAGHKVDIVTTDELQRAGKFDLVFADAPCSGSGSWRRAPHGKWLLTQSRLDELLLLQSNILDKLPELVCDTGRLAYATCSVLADENQTQVAAFLQRNPGYGCVQTRQFMPSEGGDGFFVAHLNVK